MEKRIVLVVFFIFSNLIIFSQSSPWNWAKRLGSDVGDDARDICIDRDQNILIAGSCCRGPQSSGNFFTVFKQDINGNTLWQKIMAKGGAYNICTAITTDADGNIYALGTFKDELDADVKILKSFEIGTAIIKLDTYGKVIWAKSLGAGEGIDIAYNGTDGIFIAGYHFNAGQVDTFKLTPKGNYDAYIAKMDTAGNVLWVNSVAGNNLDKAWHLAVDGDGNCYLSGVYSSTECFFGSISVLNDNKYNIRYLAKYTQNGEICWVKTMVVSPIHVKSGGLDIYNDTEIFLSGIFTAFDTLLQTIALKPIGRYDIYLAKLDTSGNVKDAYVFGGKHLDYVYAQTITGNNQVVIAGNYDTTIKFQQEELFSSSLKDVFLTSVSTSGKVLWSIGSSGGEGHSTHAIASSKNFPDVVVTGTYNSQLRIADTLLKNPSQFYKDIFVYSVNSWLISSNPHQQEINTIKIFPNPVNKQLNLIFENVEDSFIAKVYDQTGREIINEQVSYFENQIDIDVPPGIYFLVLESHQNHGIVGTYKFLVN